MSDRKAADIEADIEAIRRSIGRGILSISYDGRTVTYRSMAEMKEALAALEAELAAVSHEAGRQTRSYASFSRGYE